MTTFIVVPRNALVAQSRLATESDVIFICPHQTLNGQTAQDVVLTFWPQTAAEWHWIELEVVPRLVATAEVTTPIGTVMTPDDLMELAERRASR